MPIATERVLAEHAIVFQVLPTPVEISADCGIALMVGVPEGKRCLSLLSDYHMSIGFTAAQEAGYNLEILGSFVDC